jgi:hypothetical protein
MCTDIQTDGQSDFNECSTGLQTCLKEKMKCSREIEAMPEN